MTEIRDLRESKGLSQTAAAEVCDLSFSVYERIEMGSPRTTEEETKKVLAALRKTKATGKKLVGRPFTDPAKQKAVEEARAAGKPVSEVLAKFAPAPAPKAEPKAKAEPAKKAPAKKAPAKKAPAKPRASRAKSKVSEDLI